MKKLLSILLSILMLCTITTNTVFAQVSTVKDVLITAKGGFPTSEENAWVNENGFKLYNDEDSNLRIDTEDLIPINSGGITSIGDNYVYTDTLFDRTWTFVMEAGELVSIKVDGFEGDNTKWNGIYSPNTSDEKDVEIEYEIDFGYEWSVPSGTKTITTTESSIGEVIVTKCTLEAGKKLNISVSSKNNFNVKSGENSIAYKLSLTSGGNALVNNTQVMLVDTIGTQELFAKITGTGSAAGKYTDTLTFTASIVESE